MNHAEYLSKIEFTEHDLKDFELMSKVRTSIQYYNISTGLFQAYAMTSGKISYKKVTDFMKYDDALKCVLIKYLMMIDGIVKEKYITMKDADLKLQIERSAKPITFAKNKSLLVKGNKIWEGNPYMDELKKINDFRTKVLFSDNLFLIVKAGLIRFENASKIIKSIDMIKDFLPKHIAHQMVKEINACAHELELPKKYIIKVKEVVL